MELKKEITFIFSDTAEKNNYMPIVDEAIKRGYKVQLTDNKFARCEIGVYCQHVNFPQYSKFSVIMLHDIIQQYANWPDIWYREPWNIYDVGILPSAQWEKNWSHCSQWYYARPKVGIFKIGWPKADVINELQQKSSKEKFYQEHGLDMNKRTVLYAPAWENDHKQDDFVQSMLKLDVNILIKQAKWPDSYPQQIRNIEEMFELHKNNPRVTILPPETNIFEAIAVSDILVSEESSTMCEATMMGIPAVSVSDWLIPDVTPSRFPKCDYDFVYITKKGELTAFIDKILNQYDYYHEKTKDFSSHNFSNIGKTSAMIMDIIDDCISKTPLRHRPLIPEDDKRVPLIKDIRRKLIRAERVVTYNYIEQYRLCGFIWGGLRKIKHFITRKRK